MCSTWRLSVYLLKRVSSSIAPRWPGLNVGANMKITIHASSGDAYVASALSVYARLTYPLAEVDCLLSKTRELIVDQNEGEPILNMLLCALTHAKQSRHGLIREDIKCRTH
jgi:hypothetical protein